MFYPSRVLGGIQVVPGIHPDIIAVVLQLGKQGGFPGAKQMGHGSVSVNMGIQSGEKAASGGYAYRILADCVAERDRLPGREGIQEWRIRGGVSHMAHGVQPHLIRVENDNMWFFTHWVPLPVHFVI